ncbi:MAG: hypothetical protein ACXW3L_09400 [Limisphaerales bacterium]
MVVQQKLTVSKWFMQSRYEVEVTRSSEELVGTVRFELTTF